METKCFEHAPDCEILLKALHSAFAWLNKKSADVLKPTVCVCVCVLQTTGATTTVTSTIRVRFGMTAVITSVPAKMLPPDSTHVAQGGSTSLSFCLQGVTAACLSVETKRLTYKVYNARIGNTVLFIFLSLITTVY